MSRYVKSDSSSYLKTRRIERSESATDFQPGDTASGTTALARNSSGYTDKDERLFAAMTRLAPFAINTRRVRPCQGPRHATAYTVQDLELFNGLNAEAQNNEAVAGSPAIVLDDHIPHQKRTSPVATKPSGSGRHQS